MVSNSLTKKRIDLKDLLTILEMPIEASWIVKSLDYNTVIRVGSEFDNIIAKLENSKPISTEELKYIANNVVQVIECKLYMIGGFKLDVYCFDSTFWELVTDNNELVMKLTELEKDMGSVPNR